MIFGGTIPCFVLIKVTMSLWKYNRCVSKVKQSWKHFKLLVRNTRLLIFLRKMGSLFRTCSLYWFQNIFIFFSSGSALKSSINSAFSYFLLYVSNSLPILPRWVETLIVLRLYGQHINHLHDIRINSVKKTAMLSGKT